MGVNSLRGGGTSACAACWNACTFLAWLLVRGLGKQASDRVERQHFHARLFVVYVCTSLRVCVLYC